MLSMLIGEFSAYPLPACVRKWLNARYVHVAWAVGFGVRFGLHVDPDSEGKYIAYYLFIVLSVCA